MRLRELKENRPAREYSVLAKGLQSKLGRLVRIGGPKRVYHVNNGQSCAVLLIDGSTRAFGLAWDHEDIGAGISTVYVWNTFDINSSPDYAVDLPLEGDTASMLDMLADWIKKPSAGSLTEGELSEDTIEPRGPRGPVNAPANDVEAPEEPEAAEPDAPAQQAAPAAQPDQSKAFDDMMTLAQAKTLRKTADEAPQRIRLQAKVAGVWLDIPGLNKIASMIERMLIKELPPEAERKTMEQQYALLKQQVDLVAGGKSTFIKSLLLLGAPSSGKSHNVKGMLKTMGMSNGHGFVLKTGKITTSALWRVLIEQVNGMILFDDCDSLVKDKEAVNILKGALDTNDVREISYDSRQVFNTSTMTPEERDRHVNAMSRILRNVAKAEDLELFRPYLKKEKDEPEPSIDPEGFDIEKPIIDQQLLARVQRWIVMNPPNMIDFRGRIIFISNLEEKDWNDAIISRAIVINMHFSSGEMLDYIERIKDTIPGVLTSEQRQEVLDYIRTLYIAGRLKKQINFRMVQQAFDYRLASNWKTLVASI